MYMMDEQHESNSKHMQIDIQSEEDELQPEMARHGQGHSQGHGHGHVESASRLTSIGERDNDMLPMSI